MASVSVEQLAERAGVDEAYVRRLEELGAVRRREGGFVERDVHMVALLHMWEAAWPVSLLARS